ncbi:MAG TPA: hypothetical protein ENH32_09150 [Proteobacteria bacterium]|nr:hypothetical protein BMS3Abin14_00480 [bacterium BMS3Abin14]HDL52590.1 hypothetical protein [Pseudomonadota bacterium]HDL54128.1 hypothetical protein [Pseudomonadota bacterium]
MKRVEWFPKKRRKNISIFIGLLLGFGLTYGMKNPVIRVALIYLITGGVFLLDKLMHRKR